MFDLGELGDGGVVKVEVGFDKLMWDQREPLVQRDILELAWNEHDEEATRAQMRPSIPERKISRKCKVELPVFST